MLGELNGIVNLTLRERINKSIVGKLINAKVNFGLGYPIKKIKISLQRNFINTSPKNFREESQREQHR